MIVIFFITGFIIILVAQGCRQVGRTSLTSGVSVHCHMLFLVASILARISSPECMKNDQFIESALVHKENEVISGLYCTRIPPLVH